MATEQQRASYRIVFPPMERPTFTVEKLRFVVVDCSEHGVRYQLGEAQLPEIGTEVAGTLRFRPGDEVTVVGTVVRHAEDRSAALKLVRPIPFNLLMAEQRRLRAKYPTWK